MSVLTGQGAPSRMPGLDLLRAAAILWVMLYHAAGMGLVSSANPVAPLGWMGVDLFFALSGFLIGGQLLRPIARQEPSRFGIFYLRRLFRTLPPYLLMLSLYLVLPPIREWETMQPAWQFLTFTENLFVDANVSRTFSHAWSLCVEEQFYLVAPCVVWLLTRRPTARVTIAFLVAVVVGGMALRGYIWVHDLQPIAHITSGPGNIDQVWEERIYYPTWTRLDGLVGGMAFAAIRMLRPAAWAWLERRADLVLLVGICAFAASIAIFAEPKSFVAVVFGYPLLAFGASCLVASGASRQGLLGRWEAPGAAFVAAMAYSLYLSHKAAFHLSQQFVTAQADLHPLLGDLINGGGAMAAGLALHLIAERPALRLRDRLLGERRVQTETRLDGEPAFSPGR